MLFLAFLSGPGRLDAAPNPPEPPPADPVVPTPDPEAPPPDKDPAAPELPPPIGDTAGSVRGAPRPGEESGRTDDVDPGDGVVRTIGRGLLWIPRLPFEIVLLPIRGIVYGIERYHVISTVTEIFTTDNHKLALYPTALFETGFGLNAGIRGYTKDVLGAHEKLKARAAFGGSDLWLVEAGLDSGQLLGRRVSLSVDGIIAQHDRERFFGYGNSDDHDASGMAIHPLARDTGVASRFRVKDARVSARLQVLLPERVAVAFTSALVKKQFDATSPNNTDPDLADVYMVDALPGFVEGTRYLYNELEVSIDTRRQASLWDAPSMRSTGGLVLAYGGEQHSLDGEPELFRLGIDLQRFIRLTERPRTLQLRLWGEAVTGARDEVPFSELPRLGGDSLLRGYPVDRFRDRVAIVAQAGYTWAAASWLAPVLFVDVGRVYSGLADLTYKDPRVGFGVAFEAYNLRGLLARVEIASSMDGGIYAFLGLNPTFDARARVERH
ncbi:hypothetical protein BH11MYX3_BH11MYX3_44050 [soil metagenome]